MVAFDSHCSGVDFPPLSRHRTKPPKGVGGRRFGGDSPEFRFFAWANPCGMKRTGRHRPGDPDKSMLNGVMAADLSRRTPEFRPMYIGLTRVEC